jgi:hypothetical protein
VAAASSATVGGLLEGVMVDVMAGLKILKWVEIVGVWEREATLACAEIVSGQILGKTTSGENEWPTPMIETVPNYIHMDKQTLIGQEYKIQALKKG